MALHIVIFHGVCCDRPLHSYQVSEKWYNQDSARAALTQTRYARLKWDTPTRSEDFQHRDPSHDQVYSIYHELQVVLSHQRCLKPTPQCIVFALHQSILVANSHDRAHSHLRPNQFPTLLRLPSSLVVNSTPVSFGVQKMAEILTSSCVRAYRGILRW